MKTWKLFLYLSAIATAGGVFLPLISMPVYGEVTYFNVARDESWFIIGFALAAPAFMIVGPRVFPLICALGVWATLLSPMLRDELQSRKKTTLLQDIENKFNEKIRGEAIDIFQQFTDLEWGGYALLAACAIFTVCSLRLVFK
jgi:hypothetical protein